MVVRQEAARSLEPLRRLPQLLADAMPVVPEVLPPSTSSPQAVSALCVLWRAGPCWGGVLCLGRGSLSLLRLLHPWAQHAQVEEG